MYEGQYAGTPVAVKKMKIKGLPSKVLTEFHKECSVMKRLRHPNLVLFMGSCENDMDLMLVTELMEYGSLLQMYSYSPKPNDKIIVERAMTAGKHIATGGAYMHNFNPKIIHRLV